MQVLCLIKRLEKLTGCNPRRIGLSATLNDYAPAMEFLKSGSNRDAMTVGIKNHKRTISICVESFALPEDDNAADKAFEEYNTFLYNNCHTKKCLIFANSRANAEKTIADMKKEALRRNERDVFYVHHGSVSAELRKETEYALRENVGPTVAAATLTLELGIDIGDLDSTIQLGSPYTCSSFVQRLGRSGRRTGKSQMMFLNLYRMGSKRKNPFELMPWDLLRSVAIIQLYLEERWIEPFERKKKPFSLLAHQTLSVLMSKGELSPSELAKEVLTLPAFKGTLSTSEYRELLQYMLKEEYLQRMDNGGIIVGLKGERICNHFTFYAVFQDEETYKVTDGNGEIGNLNDRPAVGDVFILAGRSWVVISLDDERKIIYVNRTKSSKIPSFNGNGGDIHTKIFKKIKKILQEDTTYPYLQPTAVSLLFDAREIARRSGILEHDIIRYAEKSYFLCPWGGTKEMSTIKQLFDFGLKEYLDIRNVSGMPFYIDFTSGLGDDELHKKLEDLNCKNGNPDLVLNQNAVPKMDKYDYMVPDDLLKSAYLNNQMNIDKANEILNNLVW